MEHYDQPTIICYWLLCIINWYNW